MKPRARTTALLGLALALLAGAAGAEDEPPPVERIFYQRLPVRLELPVGRERIVHFPAPVRVGLPAVLQTPLRVQSIDGSLYLLAQAPFERQRLMVRELEAGRVYLLDVSAAAEGAPSGPVQIVASTPPPPREPTAEAGDGAPAPVDYGYVALTRFAAQQLYAPARLLQDLPGVVRVPVKREPVPLVRGGAVTATPLVAWRSGGLYLTAVKLTNTTRAPQTLDPRALRGSWLAATFQHHRLLPAGEEADTTALYLLSARPFEASR